MAVATKMVRTSELISLPVLPLDDCQAVEISKSHVTRFHVEADGEGWSRWPNLALRRGRHLMPSFDAFRERYRRRGQRGPLRPATVYRASTPT